MVPFLRPCHKRAHILLCESPVKVQGMQAQGTYILYTNSAHLQAFARECQVVHTVQQWKAGIGLGTTLVYCIAVNFGKVFNFGNFGELGKDYDYESKVCAYGTRSPNLNFANTN